MLATINNLHDLAEITKSAAITQTVGMIVVFSCLILIAVVVSLIGKIMVAIDNRKKAASAAAQSAAKPAPAPAAKAAAPAPQGGLTPELVAVIAAAVDTALDGRGHRILDIRQSASSQWALSGRTDIFASHRIRK